METVTVSSRFQVVIPRVIRKALDIRPGQKIQVIQYENRIELVPLKPIHEMRGFLKEIDTTIEREPDRGDQGPNKTSASSVEPFGTPNQAPI